MLLEKKHFIVNCVQDVQDVLSEVVVTFFSPLRFHFVGYFCLAVWLIVNFLKWNTLVFCVFQSNATASDAKLALFFDWLVFDDKRDNIMNIGKVEEREKPIAQNWWLCVLSVPGFDVLPLNENPRVGRCHSLVCSGAKAFRLHTMITTFEMYLFIPVLMTFFKVTGSFNRCFNVSRLMNEFVLVFSGSTWIQRKETGEEWKGS